MRFKEFQIPNTTLTNIQIDEYANKLKIKHYIPHGMLDQVKGKAKTNECGIINLDKSSGPGTHYVGYFKKGNDKIYIDSFGLKPPIEIINYLKSPILYSTFRIQKLDESNCGKYCLFILYGLSKGDDFKDVIFSLLEERTTEGV